MNELHSYLQETYPKHIYRSLIEMEIHFIVDKEAMEQAGKDWKSMLDLFVKLKLYHRDVPVRECHNGHEYIIKTKYYGGLCGYRLVLPNGKNVPAWGRTYRSLDKHTLLGWLLNFEEIKND